MKQQLSGRVVVSGSADYEEASKSHARRPFAVVFAQQEQHVRHAVLFARQNHLALRARSGRGSDADSGLVVDMSEMKRISVDFAARTVTFEPGVTGKELDHYLAMSDLYTLTAEHGSQTAFVLGGGFHREGIAANLLKSCRIVVASGKAISCSQSNNADLLWALKGAGQQQFGVVTQMTMELAKRPAARTAPITFTWLQPTPNVLQWWPQSGAFRCTFTRASACIESVGAAPQPPQELEPLEPQPLEQVAARHVAIFLHKPLPTEAVMIVKYFMSIAPNDHCSISLMRIKRPRKRTAMSLAHDQHFAYCVIRASWDDDALNWAQNFRLALLPFTAGNHVGLPCDELTNSAQSYYGSNAQRLRHILRRHDPLQVFKAPQSLH